MDSRLVQRNGQSYLKMNSMKLKVNVGKGSIHLYDLFRGDRLLGESQTEKTIRQINNHRQNHEKSLSKTSTLALVVIGLHTARFYMYYVRWRPSCIIYWHSWHVPPLALFDNYLCDSMVYGDGVSAVRVLICLGQVSDARIRTVKVVAQYFLMILYKKCNRIQISFRLCECGLCFFSTVLFLDLIYEMFDWFFSIVSGDVINSAINNNFDTLSREIFPALEKELSKLFLRLSNNIVSQYTFDQLFPDN